MISKRARQYAIKTFWLLIKSVSGDDDTHNVLAVVFYAFVSSVQEIQDAINQTFTEEESQAILEEITEACGKDIGISNSEKVLH